MRTNPLRSTLKSGKPSIGTWLSLSSPTAARFLARAGFHWLTVDIEHSSVDCETAATMFGHIADSGCIPLARVPAGKHDYIKRALDNGAYGIVVPMIMARDEAVACVRAAKYPPHGNRSLGGALHALNFDASPGEYYRRANDEILVVLQCEHVAAAERAAETFSVPGIDAVFVGPNDLRASMRSIDGVDPDHDAFEKTLDSILAACRSIGVAAGIHCFNTDDVRSRIAQGWQFIALGSDLSLMMSAAMRDLKALDLAPSQSLASY